MLLTSFIKSHLLNAENSDGKASGSGYDAGQSESKPGEAKPPADSKGSEGEGDSHDEFGYEKKPASEGKKDEGAKGDKKPEQAAPPAKEPEASTGYGVEPPVVPSEPKEPPAPVDLGFDVDTKGLPEEELPKLKEFLKNHKMSKEQAQAITENRKEFYAAQEKQRTDFAAAQVREEARIKAAWHQELKSDPTFGGEHFASNVKIVDRVVEDFMPGTKKMLTERKTMLPPYVMRDLLKLGDHLFGTGALVSGQPPAPKEESEQSDDDILKDMYK